VCENIHENDATSNAGTWVLINRNKNRIQVMDVKCLISTEGKNRGKYD
jgi:hypothetical protein